MIAAGGTGGHVYPALAIAEGLLESQPGVELIFIGSAGGFERPLIAEAGVPFARIAEVQAGPLNGVGLVRALVSLIRIVVGVVQALGLMLRARPDAVLLTGGWVCVPSGLAAWLLRVPSMIYLPDIEPALTIQALRHLAQTVAVTAPESLRFFRQGQAIVTGYPVRSEFKRATRAAGQARFEVSDARITVLVFGGSRGARSINRALVAALPALLQEGLQVLHITGTLDWDEVRAAVAQLGLVLPETGGADANGRGYHAMPYLHSGMGDALACADLVVSRAGASVLGELTLFGVPAILVPYPYAWRYQKVNADYLAAHGAAVLLPDEQMADELLAVIRRIATHPDERAAMAASSRALAQPNAATDAARALIHMTKGS